jgi:hypothetical protein
MFNLEKEITTWRQQMLAAGITAELLDELESHLRDEMDVRVNSGKSVEEAFMLAVQSMGQPSALQVEFAKNLRAPGFLPRLKAAIARLLGFPVPISKSFTAGARDALELGAMEARGFHHDFIGTEHVLLGLLNTETGVVSQRPAPIGSGRLPSPQRDRENRRLRTVRPQYSYASLYSSGPGSAGACAAGSVQSARCRRGAHFSRIVAGRKRSGSGGFENSGR